MTETLRKTKSMCPVCMRPVKASVLVRDGRVFMSKSCPEHGEVEVPLSSEAFYYRRLEEYYFSLMDGKGKVLDYELWPTLRCNMLCSSCCFGTSRPVLEGAEPGLEEIRRFAETNDYPFYTLSGGEPTCREDLKDIISVLKKNGRTVTVNSNGRKFLDKEYLDSLKRAGLDRVNIQFDGFLSRTYRQLRGTDLRDQKLAIMDNLKNSGMPTTINAVIARNTNEEEIMPLIEYAVKNDFINGLTFFTICLTGEVRDWPRERFIMPDDVIGLVAAGSNGKISREAVFRFQKLHLAVKALLKQKYCLYNQVYVLVRSGGTYRPVDFFLNFALADRCLSRFAELRRKKRPGAAVWAFAGILSLFIHYRSFFIIKELIVAGLSYFFKSARYLKSRRFLSLSFSTGCDPYKFDAAVLNNCKSAVVAPETKSGKLKTHGCGCMYNLDLERTCRQAKTYAGPETEKMMVN